MARGATRWERIMDSWNLKLRLDWQRLAWRQAPELSPHRAEQLSPDWRNPPGRQAQRCVPDAPEIGGAKVWLLLVSP
jgi:hypothetical protein